MNIEIRRMLLSDVPLKVRWINDERNNQFLHYDLPLEIEKTEIWFNRNKDKDDRFDGIIICDSIPVGVIGLLNIKDKHAELYITVGEVKYKGRGIAQRACLLMLSQAFTQRKLDSVYLFTECENMAAQHVFEKIGFKNKTLKRNDALNRGKLVDRYFYSILKEDYFEKNKSV